MKRFGVLCFLERPVLRFVLLPYYRRNTNGYFIVHLAQVSKIIPCFQKSGTAVDIFFSIWVLFCEHSRFTGQQGKGRLFIQFFYTISTCFKNTQTLARRLACKELTSAHDANRDPLLFESKSQTTKKPTKFVFIVELPAFRVLICFHWNIAKCFGAANSYTVEQLLNDKPETECSDWTETKIQR